MQKIIFMLLVPFLITPFISKAQMNPDDDYVGFYQARDIGGISYTSQIVKPFHPTLGASEGTSTNFAEEMNFRVQVLEKEGDIYKVANADLRRTMLVRSSDFQLHQNEYYTLRMRKIIKQETNSENSFDDLKNKTETPEWEVISGKHR